MPAECECHRPADSTDKHQQSRRGRCVGIAVSPEMLRGGRRTVQIFRFAAALVLLVTISLAGIALEKDNLSRQRAISLQQYRIEQLLDRQAHLRLRINELTSPMVK